MNPITARNSAARDISTPGPNTPARGMKPRIRWQAEKLVDSTPRGDGSCVKTFHPARVISPVITPFMVSTHARVPKTSGLAVVGSISMISTARFPAKAAGALALESAITTSMETFHLSASRTGGFIRSAFPAVKTASFSGMEPSTAVSAESAATMKPSEPASEG